MTLCKDARLARGMGLRDFWKATGLGLVELSKIERGHKVPTRAQRQAIEDVLGPVEFPPMPPDELTTAIGCGEESGCRIVFLYRHRIGDEVYTDHVEEEEARRLHDEEGVPWTVPTKPGPGEKPPAWMDGETARRLGYDVPEGGS